MWLRSYSILIPSRVIVQGCFSFGIIIGSNLLIDKCAIWGSIKVIFVVGKKYSYEMKVDSVLYGYKIIFFFKNKDNVVFSSLKMKKIINLICRKG